MVLLMFSQLTILFYGSSCPKLNSSFSSASADFSSCLCIGYGPWIFPAVHRSSSVNEVSHFCRHYPDIRSYHISCPQPLSSLVLPKLQLLALNQFLGFFRSPLWNCHQAGKCLNFSTCHLKKSRCCLPIFTSFQETNHLPKTRCLGACGSQCSHSPWCHKPGDSFTPLNSMPGSERGIW